LGRVNDDISDELERFGDKNGDLCKKRPNHGSTKNSEAVPLQIPVTTVYEAYVKGKGSQLAWNSLHEDYRLSNGKTLFRKINA
jgi:hypothetical protein